MLKKGESDLERRASPICAFDEKFYVDYHKAERFQRSDHHKGRSEGERDQSFYNGVKTGERTLFVGEVLDLDALTGGFNLQIAWSTAYAAGSSIF